MNTANAERWKVYDGPQINPMFSGIVCMISANDRLICVISEDEMPVSPERWPDIARLIASAPEMLAAITTAIRGLEGEFGPASARVNFPSLYEAIAKASQP